MRCFIVENDQKYQIMNGHSGVFMFIFIFMFRLLSLVLCYFFLINRATQISNEIRFNIDF